MCHKLCVIGDPVAHSLSPRIQSAFAAALGMDISYSAVTVPPEALKTFVSRSREKAGETHYDGYNVTMPHKRTITPLLDEIDETARAMNAVNTVRNDNGKLSGHNTDGTGILMSLRTVFHELTGLSVLITGSGGAASAAAHALSGAGSSVRRITRRRDTSEGKTEILSPAGFCAELCKAARGADVIINATPLGMHGSPDFFSLEFLENTSALVFDLVYNPVETSLLRRAAELRLTTIGGLSLLVNQAAEAFRIFTGTDVPDGIVRDVMKTL